ncbi:hypothetical protein ACVQFP_002793 [Yersinia enterocolitica]|uniref:DUF115 domain-containing protein n=2 Tax=Yersinia enterocolitica TaxID=630 RepID=A0A0H3NN37_YERE1|nr:hypothetical protein [Yersinia enterocolitica]EKN3312840.1 hypothetical protein [Yersinia enterocolitica]EKN3316739.1 hypothetical protein [Yersinia enterocolitica]EKN3320866.1 hypothetical protein [Yersinia enterocolitica]EKN3332716.1 hypothetical protein [Yersinia enterocolitica]EKN3352650.1 hypothetical protein [Yersinia enterocolitica]
MISFIERILATRNRVRKIAKSVDEIQSVQDRIERSIGDLQRTISYEFESKAQVIQSRISSQLDVTDQTNSAKTNTQLHLLQQARLFNENMYHRIFHEKDIQTLHQSVFPPFVNKHEGQEIAVVGCGPTLQQYQPIPSAVHIGVNKSFQHPKLELDYLFIQDYVSSKNYIEAANQYRRGQCQKFYGIIQGAYEISIPAIQALAANAYRYYIMVGYSPFCLDIQNNPLPNFNSITFSALAFALLTKPKRIYLVGCDTNGDGYFDGQLNHMPQADLMYSISINKQGWHHFRNFIDVFYPEVEVVSVNPVGLKGLFQDIYQ